MHIRPASFAVRILQSGLAAALALVLFAGVAFAATPAGDVQALNAHVANALQQLDAGNMAAAQAEYTAFHDGWFDIEDGVRGQDRAMYRAIEDRMVDVQAAFSIQPPDKAKLRAALEAQQATDLEFVQRYGGSQPAAAGPATAAAENSTSMAQVLSHLDKAQQRIAAGDASGAAAELKAFIQTWPDVEGTVATKAPDTYTATENKMGEAYGFLTSSPPKMAEASKDIADIEAGLRPFAEAPVRYNVFDAAIILLREGFEALLVVGALLAFVRRSGNPSQQGWIWGGGAIGLAVSAVIAVVVNVAFAAAGGSSRELLEGVTGLVAAGMLVWMMFWLHSKANVGAWTHYISKSAGRALATNSLMSLSLIAFLAVLREGAETVLFYVGIAPAISPSDLFAGLAIGAVLLGVLAVLMLVVGVRIPIRPFFLATSALIFFLAFKFTGFGVHSLQVAGVLQSHTAPVPSVGVIGLFPTWETTGLQLALLTGVALALWLTSENESTAGNLVPAGEKKLAASR